MFGFGAVLVQSNSNNISKIVAKSLDIAIKYMLNKLLLAQLN